MDYFHATKIKRRQTLSLHGEVAKQCNLPSVPVFQENAMSVHAEVTLISSEGKHIHEKTLTGAHDPTTYERCVTRYNTYIVDANTYFQQAIVEGHLISRILRFVLHGGARGKIIFVLTSQQSAF